MADQPKMTDASLKGEDPGRKPNSAAEPGTITGWGAVDEGAGHSAVGVGEGVTKRYKDVHALPGPTAVV